MKGSTAHKGAESPVASPSAELGRLVTTEQELEQLVSQARRDAQAIVDAALAEIRTTGDALDRELSDARSRFQADVEAERARRAQEVLAEGSRQAALLDATPATRIAELGQVVLARLLSGAQG
jgi:vacuolar-type H+-ATPase subunit H